MQGVQKGEFKKMKGMGIGIFHCGFIFKNIEKSF